jgi:hypothetical protein
MTLRACFGKPALPKCNANPNYDISIKLLNFCQSISFIASSLPAESPLICTAIFCTAKVPMRFLSKPIE